MNLKSTCHRTLAALAFCVLTVASCDNGPAQKDAAADKTDNAAKANAETPTGATTEGAEPSPAKPAPASPTKPQDAPKTPAAEESSEPEENRVKGPSWKLLEGQIHDFGTVWVDTTLTHDFKFKNVGDEPLKIIGTPKGHCSCSTPGDFTRVVQPGEVGVIPFVLTTKNSEGDLTRDLDVIFNDPQRPKLTLYMRGYIRHVCSITVVADGRIDPDDPAALQAVSGKKANFEEIAENETLFRVLQLKNTSGHAPLELRMLPVTGSQFTATLVESSPGNTYELTVVGAPPYRVGYNNGLIRFETNVPGHPTWAIPIYARLPERIEVIPTKIVCNNAAAVSKTRPITIKNHGDTPLKVTSIACSSPDYRLTLLPPDPAKPNETVIEVIIPPGDYLPPEYGEVIRIETTDAEKSLIEIMVMPSFRGAAPRPADKPLEFYPGKMLG